MTSYHLFQCDDNGVFIVPSHSSSSGSIGSQVTVYGNRSCEREVAAALGTAGSNLEWLAGRGRVTKRVRQLVKKLEQNRLKFIG